MSMSSPSQGSGSQRVLGSLDACGNENEGREVSTDTQGGGGSPVPGSSRGSSRGSSPERSESPVLMKQDRSENAKKRPRRYHHDSSDSEGGEEEEVTASVAPKKKRQKVGPVPTTEAMQKKYPNNFQSEKITPTLVRNIKLSADKFPCLLETHKMKPMGCMDVSLPMTDKFSVDDMRILYSTMIHTIIGAKPFQKKDWDRLPTTMAIKHTKITFLTQMCKYLPNLYNELQSRQPGAYKKIAVAEPAGRKKAAVGGKKAVAGGSAKKAAAKKIFAVSLTNNLATQCSTILA